MSAFSRQLVALASAQKTDNAASLQTVARLLALAQALDPQNREAENLTNRLKEKKQPHPADPQEVDRATNRAWQIESWLDSPEAGPEGKALAKCLLDVMAAVDPEHPKAAAARASGTQGAWERWVAPATEFDGKKVVKNDAPKPPDEHPAGGPKNESAKPQKVAIRLNHAAVATPLWVFDETAQKAALKVVPVKIDAWSEPGGDAADTIRIRIQSETSQDRLLEISAQVLMAVKRLHEDLPKNAKANIVIGNGAEYLFARNQNLISGPEAVLADAVLRGEEPAATVIGVIDADGAFKSPVRFWELLRSLSNGPGGRLVIPRECAPVMLSVLAIEDPGFFFKYEVICASNLKELVERSAKRNTEPLDNASVKFNEIREKLGTSAVGAFVANRFVRQRLVDVAQMFPDHLSAKMLAIQGSGERPIRLPRPILAAEIRKAAQPLFPIASKTYEEIELKAIEGACEQCKKSLDALARYTDTSDRTMAERVDETLASIRNFVRAKRALRLSSATWRSEPLARAAFDTMVKNIISCQRDLMAELGERQPNEARPN